MNKSQLHAIMVFVAIIVIISISACKENSENPVKGKVICLDPGHGGTAETDSFRIGPTGEREEWINLRVALILAEMLEDKGAEVVMTRTDDMPVDLSTRAEMAVSSQSDIFISIHHNGTADPGVNFPIIYYHGNASENLAGIQIAKILAKNLQESFYAYDVPASLISDFVIFPFGGTRILRESYGIPGIIGEASFFTNAEEEQRLKEEQYNRKEAQAYFKAINEYFSQEAKRVLPKFSKIKLLPFEAFQEEERMDSIALLWHDDFERAALLVKSDKHDSLLLAEQLLIRSLRSFPDSWIAGEAHLKRSEVLRKLGRIEEADSALLRAKEHYILIDNLSQER